MLARFRGLVAAAGDLTSFEHILSVQDSREGTGTSPW